MSKPGWASTLYSVVLITCAVMITSLLLRRELFPPGSARGLFAVEQMNRDMADAKRPGVTGTPTLLVNGRRYNGVPPLQVLEKEITEANGSTG